MKVAIYPVQQTFSKVVTVPGSKSITNRALLLAAMAEGVTCLKGVLFSQDTEACLKALNVLGIHYTINQGLKEVIVKGCAGRFPVNAANIHCYEAGTLTRFLVALACAQPHGDYRFYAAARMMERPLKPLVDVLKTQGALFEFEDREGQMPFRIKPNGLAGGDMIIDITLSSQFLSGLLMAAAFAKSTVTLHASKALTKKPYVHMSLRMLTDFGGKAHVQDEDKICVWPTGLIAPKEYVVEPDASTASYFYAAAAITGGTVMVEGVHLQMLQGDTQFLNCLVQMGCVIKETTKGVQLKGPRHLKGLGYKDMTGFSDTFMTLAVCCVFADTPTTLVGLAHTRLQESDRVAAISEEFTRLGIQTSSTEDSLTIYPSTPVGKKVFGHNDHRIAMSLALVGLKVAGVEIEGAECVAKTCPDYFERLSFLTEQ